MHLTAYMLFSAAPPAFLTFFILLLHITFIGLSVVILLLIARSHIELEIHTAHVQSHT